MSRYISRRTKRRRKIIAAILILTSLLVLLDSRIRPLVKSVAENQAKIASTNIINSVVEAELSNKGSYYSNMTTLKENSDGKVLAITTDPQKINTLKSAVTNQIQNKLPQNAPKKIKVPLGTLTGVELLMGRGPNIGMKISIPSTIKTDIISEFDQAGINQTNHKIYISVEATLYALIPGYPVTTTVTTNILVSETVIVGEVPNVYANIADKDAAAISGLSNLAKTE